MDTKSRKTKAAGPRDAKAERLAAALRANLSRRKGQARARAASDVGTATDQPGEDPQES
jgi:hypothetical protein